jgi:hypothetical protein
LSEAQPVSSPYGYLTTHLETIGALCILTRNRILEQTLRKNRESGRRQKVDEAQQYCEVSAIGEDELGGKGLRLGPTAVQNRMAKHSRREDSRAYLQAQEGEAISKFRAKREEALFVGRFRCRCVGVTCNCPYPGRGAKAR